MQQCQTARLRCKCQQKNIEMDFGLGGGFAGDKTITTSLVSSATVTGAVSFFY
jgi:hypothetical protein